MNKIFVEYRNFGEKIAKINLYTIFANGFVAFDIRLIGFSENPASFSQ